MYNEIIYTQIVNPIPVLMDVKSGDNDINYKLRPKRYIGRFIQEGIMDFPEYNDNVYFDQDTLKTLTSKFNNIPLTIDHKDLEDIGESRLDKEIVGYTVDVIFNDTGIITNKGIKINKDNWIWSDFSIDNKKAVYLLDNGWKLSCSYRIKSDAGPGIYNGKFYDKKVLDIDVDHIAIVKNPKYKESVVFENSKKMGIINKIKESFNPKEDLKDADANQQEAKKVELRSNSKIEIFDNEGGKSLGEYGLDDLIKSYMEDSERHNETEDEVVPRINLNEEIDVNGSKVKVSDLMDSYNNKMRNNEKEQEELTRDNSEKQKKTEYIFEFKKNYDNAISKPVTKLNYSYSPPSIVESAEVYKTKK